MERIGEISMGVEKSREDILKGMISDLTEGNYSGVAIFFIKELGKGEIEISESHVDISSMHLAAISEMARDTALHQAQVNRKKPTIQ